MVSLEFKNHDLDVFLQKAFAKLPKETMLTRD